MKTVLTTVAIAGALQKTGGFRRIPVKPWIVDAVEIVGGVYLVKAKMGEKITAYTQGAGAGLLIDGVLDVLDRYVPNVN